MSKYVIITGSAMSAKLLAALCELVAVATSYDVVELTPPNLGPAPVLYIPPKRSNADRGNWKRNQQSHNYRKGRK